MRRHPRLRRFLKYGGLAASTVFLTAWSVSLYVACAHTWHVPANASELRDPDFFGGYEAQAWLSHGCLRFERMASYLARIESRWLCQRAGPATLVWWPSSRPLIARQSRGPQPIFKTLGTQVFIPLWIPFLLVAGPTALLWYRGREFPAGHCQHCGYDLTGNTSGVCPECGEPTR